MEKSILGKEVMEIKVERISGLDLVRKACEMTLNGGGKSKVTLQGIYGCEHSPMRCSIFWIEMRGIPSFVSTHFVRHKIGVEHFVKTNRDDRGGDPEVTRMTPVNHGMLVNAQTLVNMARKRLCLKAHPQAFQVMNRIKAVLAEVDSDLAGFMVPECEYRRGCHEPKSCGYWKDAATKSGK
jgi:hypothetical protein